MSKARKGKTSPVPTPDKNQFGQRLQQLRKRRGLSQAALAGRLGIHQSLICQYERGYLRLHGALVVRLAAALDTTPDQILSTKELGDEQQQPAIDRRFLRRLEKISQLSAHEKKLLLGTIDAFLSKVS